MSAHGGSRAGSGRKRLYSSKNSYNEIWRRGHRRIWIDNIIYSSWVSAKLKCGYSRLYFSPLKWGEGKLALISEIPVLFFVLAVYSSSNCRFVCYQGKKRSFCVFSHVAKGWHGRWPLFEASTPFWRWDMFYNLLFKMLASFERSADSGNSTYKWFPQFSCWVKLYYISQIIGPQDVAAYLLRILLPTK